MYAGIDIGGTSIKAGIISGTGEILSSLSEPTHAEEGKDAVIQRVRNIMATLFQKAPTLKGIGVGVPGVVHPADKCVYYPPNLPGWDVVPLVRILQHYSPVRVVVGNDANVAALAESELGAGREHSHFLYVTLGTGVGGGIIVNNRLFTGEKGGAGEIGHMVIQADDPLMEPSFRTGTLEEYIGRKGLIALAQAMADMYPHSLLHTYPELDVRQISEAVERGDEAARKSFEKAGFYLGIGLASVLAILDMQLVVVGGGISQSSLLLATAQETIRQRALPTIAAQTQIRPAHFSKDAGIVGAAILAKLAVE